MRNYSNLTLGSDDPYATAHQLQLRGRHEPEVRGLIGAWRWPGMYDNAEHLVPLAKAAYAVDLGGAAGPVGYRTMVVDYVHPERKTLWDIPGRADVIFCLHTLEHVEDAELFLFTCAMKLKRGAPMVVLVPSNRNPHLHHRLWPHHRQTFHLGEEEAGPETRDLGELLSKAFDYTHSVGYTANGNLMALVANGEPEEAAD